MNPVRSRSRPHRPPRGGAALRSRMESRGTHRESLNRGLPRRNFASLESTGCTGCTEENL